MRPRNVLITLALGCLIGGFVLASYALDWRWTGFARKSLWEWLELLIIPAVLAAAGLWFTRQSALTQGRIADETRKEEDLQRYFDKVSELLLHDRTPLVETAGEHVRSVARARTLATLGRVDGRRRAAIVGFLHEASLILAATKDHPKRKPIVDLAGADLRYADLSSARLAEAHLGGADLRKACLEGADLSRATLRKADLRRAKMARASLSAKYFFMELPAHLEWEALEQYRGKGADLTAADLSAADVSGAHLRGATLGHTSLVAANLRGAMLAVADLTFADLERADLRYADLRGSNLQMAKLTRANLRGAHLDSAIMLRKHPEITDEQFAAAHCTSGIQFLDQWTGPVEIAAQKGLSSHRTRS